MFSGFQRTDAIFNILWWCGSVRQHRHPKGFGQGICTNFQVSVYMYGVCTGMHVFPAKKTKTQKADTNCWVDSQRMFLEATKPHRLHILQFNSASVNDKETACSDHQKKKTFGPFTIFAHRWVEDSEFSIKKLVSVDTVTQASHPAFTSLCGAIG